MTTINDKQNIMPYNNNWLKIKSHNEKYDQLHVNIIGLWGITLTHIWELASKRNKRRKELATQKKEEIIGLALQMEKWVIELAIQNG